MMRILAALGISLALGVAVFLAGQTFANPAHAFYAGLTVFVAGALVAPLALSTKPESHSGK